MQELKAHEHSLSKLLKLIIKQETYETFISLPLRKFDDRFIPIRQIYMLMKPA